MLFNNDTLRQAIQLWTTNREECERLYGLMENWNVSRVTNMSGLFADLNENFNEPLNNWDVSNVTNMNSMFRSARTFNQPLNNWNVSNVTQMKYMFMNATTFNQPLNN